MGSKFWQVIATNWDNSIELSTVKLPFAHGDMLYESCLFARQDNEVLARYTTLSEAIKGHAALAKQYGLEY